MIIYVGRKLMDIKEQKNNCNNWETGDTFAVKINIGSKYDGRYLIMTKVIP